MVLEELTEVAYLSVYTWQLCSNRSNMTWRTFFKCMLMRMVFFHWFIWIIWYLLLYFRKNSYSWWQKPSNCTEIKSPDSKAQRYHGRFWKFSVSLCIDNLWAFLFSGNYYLLWTLECTAWIWLWLVYLCILRWMRFKPVVYLLLRWYIDLRGKRQNRRCCLFLPLVQGWPQNKEDDWCNNGKGTEARCSGSSFFLAIFASFQCGTYIFKFLKIYFEHIFIIDLPYSWVLYRFIKNFHLKFL